MRIGAGPLIVIETDEPESHRSMPEYNTFILSNVAIDTPDIPMQANTSGLIAGSCPYKVLGSNAVDNRIDFWPLIK